MGSICVSIACGVWGWVSEFAWLLLFVVVWLFVLCFGVALRCCASVVGWVPVVRGLRVGCGVGVAFGWLVRCCCLFGVVVGVVSVCVDVRCVVLCLLGAYGGVCMVLTSRARRFAVGAAFWGCVVFVFGVVVCVTLIDWREWCLILGFGWRGWLLSGLCLGFGLLVLVFVLWLFVLRFCWCCLGCARGYFMWLLLGCGLVCCLVSARCCVLGGRWCCVCRLVLLVLRLGWLGCGWCCVCGCCCAIVRVVFPFVFGGCCLIYVC